MSGTRTLGGARAALLSTPAPMLAQRKEVVRVDLGGASLVNADGIVLGGHTLWVVQNFTRQISRLALSGDFASGVVVSVTPTPADRTFTTAKLARGRLLLVDSQFGLPQPWEAEDRVVAMRLP